MYELFLRAKEKVGFSEIVKQLNLAPGTVKRWEEKRQVPKDYFMDLKRLCEEEIDLSKLSYREKGQFFTPTETAKRCIEVTKQVLKQNGFLLNNILAWSQAREMVAFLICFLIL